VSAAPDPDRLGESLRAQRKSGAERPGVRRAGVALTSTVGCRFSPRCPLSDERCKAQAPPLASISRQRAVACWRVDVAAPELLSQIEDGEGGGS
jgi:ABC-type dipeptide/oligopeptide/nickel transport system ATPase component